MRSLKAVMLATVLAAGGGSLALAAGGAGGMGGGQMSSAGSDNPSASGPRYDPAAEYAKGVAAMRAKDYRNASRAFAHVTEVAPRSGDAWRLLGAAKAGEADWKGSRKAYEKAVKLMPDDVVAHAGLGLALGNLKDAKAQSELQWLKTKAQACGDTCPEAATLKGLSVQVEQAIGGAPETKPSAAIDGGLLFADAEAGDKAYVAAVSLINQKRYDEALASLAAAGKAFGPHPDILTYQGYTWRKMGDLGRAEQYYRQALAIDPGHIGATEYYGELKVARGDIAGAKVMLARLDQLCGYGCADAEELRRWIDAGREPQ